MSRKAWINNNTKCTNKNESTYSSDCILSLKPVYILLTDLLNKDHSPFAESSTKQEDSMSD